MISAIAPIGYVPPVQGCNCNSNSEDVNKPAKIPMDGEEAENNNDFKKSPIVDNRDIDRILSSHGFIGRGTSRKEIIKLFLELHSVEVTKSLALNLSASAKMMEFCKGLMKENREVAEEDMDEYSGISLDVRM